MATEKILLNENDRKLTSAIDELKLTTQDPREIEECLADPALRDIFLNSIKNKAEQKKNTAQQVLDLL